MFQQESTPYDWNFRLFGVDVRVSPWFWLMGAAIGWTWTDLGMTYLALWMVCVFVSILIHEMGHVMMGRAFGSDGHILLYSFGGLAIGSNRLDRRWQRILVSLAGPFAQFVVYGAVELLRLQTSAAEQSEQMAITLLMLRWINLYWALFNLLPVFPLDGGQVSRELFQAARPNEGTEWSLWLSIGVCALIALNSIAPEGIVPYLPKGGPIFALFFGVMAYNNYLEIQFERSRSRW